MFTLIYQLNTIAFFPPCKQKAPALFFLFLMRKFYGQGTPSCAIFLAMYTLTLAEEEILTCLASKKNASHAQDLFTAFPDRKKAVRALEGCIAKGFVKNDGGLLTLTQLGREQL